MRRARLFAYQIPMDAGVVLRHQRLKTRDGLVVCLTEGERQGWGEIAPLPGFSRESLDDCRQAALVWLQAWQRGQEIPLPAYPAAAFGLSTAQAELEQRLPAAADYRAVPLCTGDPDTLFARLAVLPGEKIAKMKVGLYEAVRDGMMVNLLLEAMPDLRLRLDANRAWTPEKARQFARYVNPAWRDRIVWIEEPCTTREASRRFAEESGIAIAWDESLREADFRIEARPREHALIIKPMLTGSLQRVREQVVAAHTAGLTVVISSSLESSLGLTQLARLAAWLTPDVVPGLDTLSLMQAQLLRPWPGSALPLMNSEQMEVLL